ncbi:MAG: UDP-N-acetylmuramoyl-tripeptide--D-alanyl-D-alanine ligase [Clostridia bacterium]|nr:UDP-N-acetylmuramoyl-tripeptide--D-alanyl-D-alanine ligase [Clostridia bacterium]
MSAALKIREITPAEIARATGGRLVTFGNGAAAVSSVVIDSREAAPGALFCAIRGERTDGHAYIAAAVASGCTAVLCEREPEGITGDFAAVVVDDTVRAMNDLAAWYKSLLPLRTVAVTGSVGKTTTKELIASVVSTRFRTLKTEGNLNSTIGLPLTLFSLRPDDEAAVLEMGMNHPGEISRMSKTARPDIAVITNVGTAHLEYLGSREGILRAKMEITDGMTPGEGMLILSGDNDMLRTVASSPMQPVYFSASGDADCAFYATDVTENAGGVSFTFRAADGTVWEDVRLPLIGLHNVGNALAAIAVGRKLGLTEDEIRRGLLAYRAVGMRQNIVDVGGVRLIEDCYNANPESMRAALGVLRSVAKENGGGAVALLGDMLELGTDGPRLHREIGAYAATLGLKYLFCYGPLAAYIREGAVCAGMSPDKTVWEPDTDHPERLADEIVRRIGRGDTVLVKASRGIAAENVSNICRDFWNKNN